MSSGNEFYGFERVFVESKEVVVNSDVGMVFK